MRVQHLVLDDDVHKALKAYKRSTGATVREIGNSALRSALSLPTPEDLLVEQLVAMGSLSREDYDRAVAEAERELRALQAQLGKEILPGPGEKPLRVGSWEGRVLHTSPDGLFQVVLYRARNGKNAPSPVHRHGASRSWAYVLRGRVTVQVGKETIVLRAHESVYVPPDVPHNSAPLSRDTAMLILMSPPETPSRRKLGRQQRGATRRRK